MIIREKDRLELCRIFEKMLPKDVEIWAYGSRVNGSAHDGSDLDLVLRTPNLKALDYEIFWATVEEIKESNIPILVELRDWARLPVGFHQEILKQYEILFRKM